MPKKLSHDELLKLAQKIRALNHSTRDLRLFQRFEAGKWVVLAQACRDGEWYGQEFRVLDEKTLEVNHA